MPAQPLDDTMLKELVTDATAAPSMHNAQPWRFRYGRAAARSHSGRSSTVRCRRRTPPRVACTWDAVRRC